MTFLRLALLCSLLLLFAAPTSAESVYALVDNSKSMAGAADQKTISDTLVEIRNNLPENSALSISTFGGRGSNCSSPVEITPIVPVTSDYKFTERPPAGGYTQTIRALEAAFATTEGRTATIILVTDGIYSCGVAKDVCSISRNLETNHPNIRLRKWLVRSEGAEQQLLSCILDYNSTDVASNFQFLYRHILIRLLYIAPLILWGIALFRWLLASAKNSREILEQLENPDESNASSDEIQASSAEIGTPPTDTSNGESTPPPNRLSRFLIFVLVVVFGAALIACIELYAPGAALARSWWLRVLNSAFGSLFASSLFAGFVGWVLLERWKSWQALNTKAVREFEATKENNRKVQRKAEILRELTGHMRTKNDYDKDLVEKLLKGSLEIDGDRLIQLRDRISSVRDWMLTQFMTLDVELDVERYSAQKFDTLRIARRLLDDNVIQKDRHELLREVFRQWKTAVQAKSSSEFDAACSAIMTVTNNKFSF